MSFDSMPICFDQKVRADSKPLETIHSLGIKGGMLGHFSLQGLVKGGTAKVTISYSNHSELGWVELMEINFEDDVMQHVRINDLVPCKLIRYELTNTSGVDIKVSLVPCYI